MKIQDIQGFSNGEMLPVVAYSMKQRDIFLLASAMKRLPISQHIQICPSSTSAKTSVKGESAPLPPSLPVQPLDKTLEKYLKSVKPFVDSAQLETTKNLLKSFSSASGIGSKLQKLLEGKASSTDNWLAEWWLSTAYLEYRSPVVIYSSPGLVWPQQNFKTVQDQINYTASLISAALEYNAFIEGGKVPQEMLGGRHPLCMSQYNKIFGTHRVPKMPRDDLLFQDPKNPSTNIIVMYNNHVYSLPAFEGSSRKPLSSAQFYGMLKEVVEDGEKSIAPPVGILTTEHRDNWARAYAELKKDPNNKNILENYVEKALFVVCIDKPLTTGSGLNYETRCSKLLLHGFGIRGNGGNRWYDKTIQFIIGAGSDGVGVAYEHSPAEGGPIGVLTDFVIERLNATINLSSTTNVLKPQKLIFNVSDAVNDAIQTAGKELDRLSNDLDVFGFTFPNFGKNQLKQSKVSPDSFIQIAIQYAYYKVHNKPAAQYESGSLRKYVHGRTDIIRTCSEEVVQFCKAMTDRNSSKEERCRSLLAALEAHKNYATEVVHGRGVDRHLLGLKLLALENQIQEPEIFKDASYKQSTYFQLSTSNVPTKCNGFMVYGPLVDDGYACCYNPRDNTINFGTSAWSTCPTTRLTSFKEALESALIEMKDCLPGPTVQSKL